MNLLEYYFQLTKCLAWWSRNIIGIFYLQQTKCLAYWLLVEEYYWNIIWISFPTNQVPGLLVEASWSKAGVVAGGRSEAQLGLSHPGQLIVIVSPSNCASNWYWFIIIQKIHFYWIQVRSLSTLVTHSLTNSLLFSRLDWCDSGFQRCQLKTSSCY